MPLWFLAVPPHLPTVTCWVSRVLLDSSSLRWVTSQKLCPPVCHLRADEPWVVPKMIMEIMKNNSEVSINFYEPLFE